MTRPFFSIVVPTKNRASVVKFAITSIMKQTFSNFEVVVADNDDSTETHNVIHTFDDARLRYIRTGQHSMADNWEAGSRAARGVYQIILEDKMVLKRWALERLYACLKNEAYPVLTWWRDILDDRKQITKLRRWGKDTGVIQTYSSKNILESFMTDLAPLWNESLVLPLGHYCAVHWQVLEQIRNCSDGRVFQPVTPDYTHAFAVLACVDSIARLDESIAIAWKRSISTGKSAVAKGTLARQFLAENVTTLNSDRLMPIPLQTINALVYNDFLRMQSLIGGNLLQVWLNPMHIFVQVYYDIVLGKQVADYSEEEQIWYTALGQQPSEVQRDVHDRLAKHPMPTIISAEIEPTISKPPQVPRWKLWLNKLRGAPPLVTAATETPPVDDILRLLEWDEQQFRSRTAQKL